MDIRVRLHQSVMVPENERLVYNIKLSMSFVRWIKQTKFFLKRQCFDFLFKRTGFNYQLFTN